jgi:RNA-directed DNA polymerase
MERIVEPENLRRAWALARRANRHHREALPRIADLDHWLRALGEELRSGSVSVGELRSFVIHDPKRRIIHAPAFRERVVHHAVMSVVGPVLERRAIDDSYACRKHKGVHRARDRAFEFARRHRFYLKLDVRRYFDSVSHAVLLELLGRFFKDPELMLLFGRIVRAYETAPGTGLPIGSLTSQHFANLYLGPVDRFVKEELRAPGYVRYMDDLVLWANEPSVLESWGHRVEELVHTRLRLELKGVGAVGKSHDGLGFLGARITPWAIYPSRRTRRRLQSKLAACERAHAQGALSSLELQRRASALLGVVESMRCRNWRRYTLIGGEVA